VSDVANKNHQASKIKFFKVITTVIFNNFESGTETSPFKVIWEERIAIHVDTI